MTQLAAAFAEKVVGLSDHTTDNLACISAIALGASIVERHFTDHMQRPGPDIVCSMDEQRCRDLIEAARIVHMERGGTKGPAAEEQVTIDFAFATVVTTAAIRKGERFTRDNLWVKRPGTGALRAERYEEVLGRTATRDLAGDTHISMDDVS
jgi:N-acetylneuraminate synthase